MILPSLCMGIHFCHAESVLEQHSSFLSELKDVRKRRGIGRRNRGIKWAKNWQRRRETVSEIAKDKQRMRKKLVSIDCVECSGEQGDQMDRLFFTYLAIYNNGNLPRGAKNVPK